MPRRLFPALVSSLWWVLLSFSSPLTARSYAPPPPTRSSPSAHMALEEPTEGSTYSGVANVRGWVVAAPNSVSEVHLFVDNQFFGYIPVGGERSDVGAAYPGYPGSAQSGFAMAFNYSALAVGSHTFTVRAYAADGSIEVSATMNVVRFDSSYMADPAAVNLDQATLNSGGNTITIQNLLADGKAYNVQLNWRPAAQGFALSQIAPADIPASLPVGALESVNSQTWAGWACEPDHPSTTLKVELYLNSNRVTTAQANLSRSDISSRCGNSANHGFSWSPSGSRLTINSGDRVYAYALHSTDDGKTLIGSKVCNIVCSNPNDITSCNLSCQ